MSEFFRSGSETEFHPSKKGGMMQESGHLAARRLTGRVGSPQRPSPPEALLFLLLIHQPPAESPTEENNHTHTRVTPPHVHTTDSVSLPPRTEKCSLLTRTPGSSGPQCPEPDPDPGPARTGHEGAVPLQGNDPCQLRSHVGNQLGGTSGGWTKWPGGCQVEGCQVGPLRVVLQPRVIILTCRLCRL